MPSYAPYGYGFARHDGMDVHTGSEWEYLSGHSGSCLSCVHDHGLRLRKGRWPVALSVIELWGWSV